MTAMHKLGQTRSTNQRDHLLHTPDTFVRTVLQGMERATAVVHISPAAGAAFTQYTAELEPGGSLGHTSNQRFLYLLEGAADLAIDSAAGEPAQPSGFGQNRHDGEVRLRYRFQDGSGIGASNSAGTARF